jgi:hypothetical protein
MCIASLVKPFTCRSSHHDSCFFYPLANSVKSGWLATSIWWVQVVMIKARRCWNMTQEIIFGCLETFTHWLGNFQLPRLTPEDDQSDGRCPHVILMKIPMPFCCAEQNRLFWDSVWSKSRWKKNRCQKSKSANLRSKKSAVPQPSGEEWIDARDVLIVPDGPLSGRWTDPGMLTIGPGPCCKLAYQPYELELTIVNHS